MRRFVFTAAIAAAIATATSASAALMLSPTLNPGDQYRIAFVTSDNFLTSATSTNVSDYNQVATDAANSQPDLAALNTDWFAIVSVPGNPGVSAKENTGTDDSPVGDNGVPIFRVDAVKIADHYDDLWDNNIDAALEISEDGTTQDALVVWSGTMADGTINTAQPLGGSELFTGRGQIGGAGSLWIATFGDIDETVSNPIYVVSDVLTVVPEPASLALLALGGLASFFGRNYVRPDKAGNNQAS